MGFGVSGCEDRCYAMGLGGLKSLGFRVGRFELTLTPLTLNLRP